MQNKANLGRAQIGVNFFVTSKYEEISGFGYKKNKPNSPAGGRKLEILNPKSESCAGRVGKSKGVEKNQKNGFFYILQYFEIRRYYYI